MRCNCLHCCPHKINLVAIKKKHLVTTGGGRMKELNNLMVSIIALGIESGPDLFEDL